MLVFEPTIYFCFVEIFKRDLIIVTVGVIMDKVKKVISTAAAIAALSLSSSAALAAGNGTGVLGFVLVLQSPDVAIVQTPVNTGLAACATTGQWQIDITNSIGKSIYATMLTAKATGSSVRVVGTGACGPLPDRETISWILMN